MTNFENLLLYLTIANSRKDPIYNYITILEIVHVTHFMSRVKFSMSFDFENVKAKIILIY